MASLASFAELGESDRAAFAAAAREYLRLDDAREGDRARTGQLLRFLGRPDDLTRGHRDAVLSKERLAPPLGELDHR